MNYPPQQPPDLFTTNKKAYADSVLNANKHLDWVKRLYEKNAPSIQVKGEPNRSTHLMADDGKGYVYPTIIRDNGKLKHLSEDEAYDYAKKTNTGIQLPQKQGSWFAANGYKIAPNVNNDIDEHGLPRNNPNLNVDNSGNVVNEPKPLNNEEKQAWNGFVDYLDKQGLKGSTALDNKNMALGQNLLNKYNSVRTGAKVNYEDVSRVQAELQAYRANLVDRWKKGQAQSDQVKTEADIMPNLSPVDSWLGSKTSSYKFPTAVLTNNGKTQDFGVDTKAYDATMAQIKK